MKVSALLASVAQAPLRGMRVSGVPATESSVDPFGIRLETGAELSVKRVLLGRLRVRNVGLATAEVDDQGGASGLSVLPHDLGADVADGALALTVVPLFAECEELTKMILSHLQARDRPVHLIPLRFTAGCCRAFVWGSCPAFPRESVARQ